MTRSGLACTFAATALLAGCGASGGPVRAKPAQLPRALARSWASQASAIAQSVAAGDSCQADRLAGSLRDEVVAAEPKVPARLYGPLLAGVNSLANRVVCVVAPVTVTSVATATEPPPPKEHRKPPKPPKPPHDHHHDHHGHGGDQGSQG